LALAVGPPDASGYHPVQSLVCPLTFGDRLNFERQEDGIKLESNHPTLPLDDSNLIARAYSAVKACCPQVGGTRVRVEKNIPIGGGLGGGSSNAAATINTLDRLYELKLSIDTKMRLGASLGADVPCFILGRAVFAGGYGQVVTPINGGGGFWVVVGWQGIPVATKWAYERYDRYLSAGSSPRELPWGEILVAFQGGEVQQLARVIGNHLEAAVLPELTGIAKLKEQMLASGALNAMLCGSGESVFAIMENKEKGERLAKRLVDGGCQAVLCQVVNQIELPA
jgi:4-diphosphocytidyl-2-C-methyl-D-erythritol kinase